MNDFGDRLGASLSGIVTSLLDAIPDIIGFLIILAVGWIVSGIIGRIVTRVLQGVGADRLFAQHGTATYGQAAARFTPSRAGGEVVKWLIRLIALVAAFNMLGITQVSLLLNQVLLWIPNLIVAAVILLVAPVIARFVRGVIEVGAGQMGFTNAGLLGRMAEIAIVVFAVIVAINQIGIAANLVNTLFIGFVGALALAFGLAFGLGGREVAAQITQDWYQSMQNSADRIRSQAQQQGGQAQPGPQAPPPQPAAGYGTAPTGSPARPR